MTLHFPFLELQVTYSMTSLRRRRSKERTKPVCFAMGPLPGSPCLRLLQCQLSLAQGEATLCLLCQPQPHSCTTTSSSRPAAAGNRDTGCPGAPTAHEGLPTLGSALPTRELQDVCLQASAAAKRIQMLRNHPTARLRLNHSNATPLQTGILRRLLNIPPFCKTSVFIQC